MDIESYRYLMSALIQVFGALVGVDAIFLILRYERIKERVRMALTQVGFHTSMIERQGEIFRNSIYKSVIYQECKDDADLLVLLTPEKVAERIQGALDKLQQTVQRCTERGKEKLDELQENLTRSERRKSEEDSRTIEAEKSEYEKHRNTMAGFPTLVMRSMAAPAVLSLVFCMFLMFSHTIDSASVCNVHMIKITALSSIFLSAVGFLVVIYYARKAFD